MRIRSLVGLALFCTACGGPTDLVDADSSADRFQTFTVDQLRAARAQQGTSFYRALADSAFEMGLLNAPAGGEIGLITHTVNVVYHVVGGAGTLSTVDMDLDFDPGALIFVRGAVEHRFHAIASELDAVVVFATVPPAPHDPDLVAFTLPEMVDGRAAEENVWTPLLVTSTMSMGMYMLPKGGSDAGVFNHDFDEFKIVVNGGARFDLGSGGAQVAPGTVTFIEDDVRHQFRRVSDDLDVIVVWAN